MSDRAEAYLWFMARKLVLTGPAAEAVERLARSAGVSPSELIKRALRREDEAQRGEAESRVKRYTGGLPESSESVQGQEEPFHEHEHEDIFPDEGRSEALLAFIRNHGNLPEDFSIMPFHYDGTLSSLPALYRQPTELIEIPVAAGTPGVLIVAPSEAGRSLTARFSGDRLAEPGEAAEAPPSAIKPGKPGERG
jgi:Ribbon-helix-helix protein, copG family